MSRSSRPGLPVKFALYNFILLVAFGFGLSYLMRLFAEPGNFRTVGLAVGAALTLLFLVQVVIVRAASRALTSKNLELTQSSDEQAARYEALKARQLETLLLINRAGGDRDQVTSAHSDRLTKIAHKMGGRLGLSPNAHRRIEYASLFHDIGNIGIPDSVLQKTGPLNEEETARMSQHARLGAELMRTAPFLADTAGIVEHHHERFDGHGYPAGLAGGEIPIEARILSVIDAFDKMTHDRPDSPALPPDVAVNELIKGKGGQFDPGVVELFLLYLAEDEGVTLPPEGEDELPEAA